MILFYRILVSSIYPLLIVIIFFRKFLRKEDNTRYKEKIFPSHFNIIRKKENKMIWFHAASIGELKSVTPLINELIRYDSQLEFLITTTTLSSSGLAKKKFKNLNNVHHRFFPVDVGFIIKTFLKGWKPNIIFLVDSEIWPNLILSAKKNNIPIVLINARITNKTFNRWLIIPKFAKYLFNIFNFCLASSNETKKNLAKLNAKNIFYFGNLKLFSEIEKNDRYELNSEILKKNKFWLAASTHDGEEELCIHTHLRIKEKHKKIITIIAPRHINRVNKIKKLCEKYKLKTQVLNQEDKILNEKEIIIINSFGSLPKYFKYAKSVFMGKSYLKKLESVGGQNPIEAAKYDCKIYHGPYVYNFNEIYEVLKKNKISTEIRDHNDLGNYLIKDMEFLKKIDKRNSIYLENLGKETFNKTVDKIKNFLKNEIN